MKKLIRFMMLLVLAAVTVQTVAASGGIELPMIPGTTHTYGPWTVKTEATCTQKGVEKSVCSTCGKERTRNVAALGHTPVTDGAVAPTCTENGLTEGSHCGRCQEVLVKQQVLLAAHTYSDWHVLQEATFAASGQRQKTCGACGDTQTETVNQLVGKVEQWNVNLEDMLRIELHLNISKSIWDTAAVQIAVGTAAGEYALSDLETNEDGLYVASVELAAAQMATPVTVRVVNGEDQAEASSYTVRGYADTVLSDDSMSRYHDLVEKMLHYGAAAQAYFGKTEDGIADDNISASNSPDIPQTADQPVQITGSVPGISFYAASLLHQDRVAMRYYFKCTEDISRYRFVANGVTYTPDAKGDLYYIDFSRIAPDALDQQVLLTVSDTDGNELTVGYSPLNYMIRMNQKAELKALLKALYGYHLAAKSL